MMDVTPAPRLLHLQGQSSRLEGGGGEEEPPPTSPGQQDGGDGGVDARGGVYREEGGGGGGGGDGPSPVTSHVEGRGGHGGGVPVPVPSAATSALQTSSNSNGRSKNDPDTRPTTVIGTVATGGTAATVNNDGERDNTADVPVRDPTNTDVQVRPLHASTGSDDGNNMARSPTANANNDCSSSAAPSPSPPTAANHGHNDAPSSASSTPDGPSRGGPGPGAAAGSGNPSGAGPSPRPRIPSPKQPQQGQQGGLQLGHQHQPPPPAHHGPLPPPSPTFRSKKKAGAGGGGGTGASARSTGSAASGASSSGGGRGPGALAAMGRARSFEDVAVFPFHPPHGPGGGGAPPNFHQQATRQQHQQQGQQRPGGVAKVGGAAAKVPANPRDAAPPPPGAGGPSATTTGAFAARVASAKERGSTPGGTASIPPANDGGGAGVWHISPTVNLGKKAPTTVVVAAPAAAAASPASRDLVRWEPGRDDDQRPTSPIPPTMNGVLGGDGGLKCRDPELESRQAATAALGGAASRKSSLASQASSHVVAAAALDVGAMHSNPTPNNTPQRTFVCGASTAALEDAAPAPDSLSLTTPQQQRRQQQQREDPPPTAQQPGLQEQQQQQQQQPRKKKQPVVILPAASSGDPDEEEQKLFESRLTEDHLGVAVRKINQNGKSQLRYVRCVPLFTGETPPQGGQQPRKILASASVGGGGGGSIQSHSNVSVSRSVGLSRDKRRFHKRRGDNHSSNNSRGSRGGGMMDDDGSLKLPQGGVGGSRQRLALTWGNKTKVTVPLDRFTAVRKGKTTDRTRRNPHPSSQLLSVLTDDPAVTLDVEAPTRLDRDKFARAFASFLGVPLETEAEYRSANPGSSGTRIKASATVGATDSSRATPSPFRRKGHRSKRISSAHTAPDVLHASRTSTSTSRGSGGGSGGTPIKSWRQVNVMGESGGSKRSLVGAAADGSAARSISSKGAASAPGTGPAATPAPSGVAPGGNSKKGSSASTRSTRESPGPRVLASRSNASTYLSGVHSDAGGGVGGGGAESNRTTAGSSYAHKREEFGATAGHRSGRAGHHHHHQNSHHHRRNGSNSENVNVNALQHPSSQLPQAAGAAAGAGIVVAASSAPGKKGVGADAAEAAGTSNPVPPDEAGAPAARGGDRGGEKDGGGGGEDDDDQSTVSSLTAGFEQEIVEELHQVIHELRNELEASRAEASRAVKVAEQAIQSAESCSSSDWNSTVTHKAAEAAAQAQKRSAEAMARQRLAEEKLAGERRAAAFWRRQAEAAEEDAGALQTRAASAEVQREVAQSDLLLERRRAEERARFLKDDFSDAERKRREALDAAVDRNRNLEVQLERMRLDLAMKCEESRALQDQLAEAAGKNNGHHHIESSTGGSHSGGVKVMKKIARRGRRKKKGGGGDDDRSLSREPSSVSLLADASANATPLAITADVLTVEKVSQLHHEASSIRHEFEILKRAAQEEMGRLPDQAKDWTSQVFRALTSARRETEHLRQKLAFESAIRRKLHHQVHDYRGTIRVYVRPRPPRLLQSTAPSTAGTGTVEGGGILSVPSHQTLVLHRERTESLGGQQVGVTASKKPSEVDDRESGVLTSLPISFEFDRVFAPHSSQKEVYDEVEELTMSVLDGYSVTLLAFGQTGSGKSHTLLGDRDFWSWGEDLTDGAGVHMLALQQLFAVSEARRERYQDSFAMTILEVKDERLCDLVAGTPTASESGEVLGADVPLSGKRKGKSRRYSAVEDSNSQSGSNRPQKLEIKSNYDGDTVVQGLTSVPIKTLSDVCRLWEECHHQRASRLKEQSIEASDHDASSHTIFTVSVLSTNIATGVGTVGKIQFVDLAGADLVSKKNPSSSISSTQKVNVTPTTESSEWKYANKSLATLSEVVDAKCQFVRNVPYRNSTLTHLLRDSFEGDAKVLMFLCLSSDALDMNETSNAIRFAQRIKRVSTGVATKRTVSSLT